MDCEKRGAKRSYYLSYQPAGCDERWKGQEDPAGKVHSGRAHLLCAGSAAGQCHLQANTEDGVRPSEFLGRKRINSQN